MQAHKQYQQVRENISNRQQNPSHSQCKQRHSYYCNQKSSNMQYSEARAEHIQVPQTANLIVFRSLQRFLMTTLHENRTFPPINCSMNFSSDDLIMRITAHTTFIIVAAAESNFNFVKQLCQYPPNLLAVRRIAFAIFVFSTRISNF